MTVQKMELQALIQQAQAEVERNDQKDNKNKNSRVKT